jgi:tRNA (guanine-N7-)-methyltransferase
MVDEAPDDDDVVDGDDDADEEATATSARPRVLPTLLPSPINWSQSFGRAAPLEVELGFGRPHFLLERADEAPTHNVVGIEWKGKWPKAVWRKQERGLYPHVRALHGNAWLLFPTLFFEATVHAVYINFPDPWWKQKHRKRRLLNPVFVDSLASALVDGGCVMVQTDVASLLEEYLACLEEHPDLVNPHGAFRLIPRKPMAASSHREKRCRNDGVPIWRALVVRKPRGSA